MIRSKDFDNLNQLRSDVYATIDDQLKQSSSLKQLCFFSIIGDSVSKESIIKLIREVCDVFPNCVYKRKDYTKKTYMRLSENIEEMHNNPP